MSNDLLEIKILSRGGQGGKTLALFFAELAALTGKFVQAFPEYGPERMGAPVQAFVRLSDSPITLHCAVRNPDIFVFLDATLIDAENRKEAKKTKIVLINTPTSIDASLIARQELKIDKPNTAMLGALAKITGLLDLKTLKTAARQLLEQKFARQPELIEKNLRAVERGWQEVIYG